MKATRPQQQLAANKTTRAAESTNSLTTPLELLSESLHNVNNDKNNRNNSANLSSILSDLLTTSMYEEADLPEEAEAEEL